MKTGRLKIGGTGCPGQCRVEVLATENEARSMLCENGGVGTWTKNMAAWQPPRA